MDTTNLNVERFKNQPIPARDGGWNEKDHPRGDDGKFGSGGNSKSEKELLEQYAAETRSDRNPPSFETWKKSKSGRKPGKTESLGRTESEREAGRKIDEMTSKLPVKVTFETRGGKVTKKAAVRKRSDGKFEIVTIAKNPEEEYTLGDKLRYDSAEEAEEVLKVYAERYNKRKADRDDKAMKREVKKAAVKAYEESTSKN